MSELSAVVLAAGQGTRMKSSLPKVLHPLAGRPLVYYPARAALAAGATQLVLVLSPETLRVAQDELKACFGAARLDFRVQDPPRGSGDAARVGLEAVSGERVLILNGDVPLLGPDDLRRLLEFDTDDCDVAVLSCLLDDPSGYGRVLRDEQGRAVAIREHRDLKSDEERALSEINAGVYAANTAFMRDALARVTPSNAQGEYYLTDVVALAEPGRARALPGTPDALVGVNNRAELAHAERLMHARIAARHAESGVTIHGSPSIDDSVEIAPDAKIFDGVQLRGKTRIGAGTRVDTGCVIEDASIGADVTLLPYSVVLESSVEDGARIGPFAHLRPGSEIGPDAHIGNFVETKKTKLHRGAKANHLAYLGDGEIGEGANVGAGTIFCNYDGFMKHKTTIEAGAFIGSDSQLVAPVRIGKNAYVATGTTVTKDVPDDALAIARVKQENKEGYATRLRGRLAAAKKEQAAK